MGTNDMLTVLPGVQLDLRRPMRDQMDALREALQLDHQGRVLARLARFGGHGSSAVWVSSHARWLCRLVGALYAAVHEATVRPDPAWEPLRYLGGDPDDVRYQHALWALLHEADEVVLGEIPVPFRRLWGEEPSWRGFAQDVAAACDEATHLIYTLAPTSTLPPEAAALRHQLDRVQAWVEAARIHLPETVLAIEAALAEPPEAAPVIALLYRLAANRLSIQAVRGASECSASRRAEVWVADVSYLLASWRGGRPFRSAMAHLLAMED